MVFFFFFLGGGGGEGDTAFSQVWLFLETISSWSASDRGLFPLGKLRSPFTRRHCLPFLFFFFFLLILPCYYGLQLVQTLISVSNFLHEGISKMRTWFSHARKNTTVSEETRIRDSPISHVINEQETGNEY